MSRVTLGGRTFEVAAFSEQGPRSENQDAFAIDGFPEVGILALADGMGGEKGGRVAADAALETILRAAPLRSLEDARRAVRDADRRVALLAESNPGLHGGVGCALGVLAFVDGKDGSAWVAAHVGDVRILSRSPDGVLRLETRDHTPAFARWEAGEITLDEIPDSAGANRLQRAVGRGGEADVVWLPIGPGWSWLIVSDGIYKAMRLDELSRALGARTTEAACDSIRRKVEERGPDDNFTAVLVRALGSAPAGVPDGDRTEPMISPAPPVVRRPSALSGFAAGLSLLAIVVAGLAFWTAREGRLGDVDRLEMERLRIEVDSLRVLVDDLSDPFGPSAPAQLPGTTPPQQQPAP